MNILLVVYSGNKYDALSSVKAKFPGSDIHLLTKPDLKRLSRKEMIRLLRKQRRNIVVIFCENINTQNQIILLKLLGMLTKAKQRMITDKKGDNLAIIPFQLLFIEFPLYLVSWGSVFVTMALANFVLVTLNILAKLRKEEVSIYEKSNRKVKIAYLRTDYSSDKTGGAMSHISGFSNAILNLGHELFFISSGKIYGVDEKKASFHIVKPVSYFNRIAVELSQVAYNLKFILRSYKIIKNDEPDFLYQRSSAFNCSGALLSFLLRKPLILEFNSSALWKTDKWVRQRFRITRLLIERLNLIWSHRIMVVSEILRRQLKSKGVDLNKIVVNPNAADPDIFNPSTAKKDFSMTYGISNKIIVGFAGMFGQWHGVETLVRCVKHTVPKNKHIHFLLIGDGILRDKLEKIVETDGTSEFIRFTGIVPKKEMPTYLNACDILVSPHRNMADGQSFFGSPIKIFEYMAMGKPIVASEVGQLKEILEHEKNAILVPPDDPEKLATAIVRLASDSELREVLGRKARNDLIQNYTWTNNAKRVMDSYKKTIGQ